jgi:hypothetical protein
LARTDVTDRTGWLGLFTFNVLADTRDMPYQAVLMQRTTNLGAALPVDAPHLLEVFRNELGVKPVKDRNDHQRLRHRARRAAHRELIAQRAKRLFLAALLPHL